MSGVQRIEDAFSACEKSAALITYMMGGFPNLKLSKEIAKGYIDGGADIVEVGIPFSDPLADGPVIQSAGTAALDAGGKVKDALALAGEIAKNIPVVIMTYTNIVLSWGSGSFISELAEKGIDGLILADLPFEESNSIRQECDQAGIALIPLVAPTTPDDRIAKIVSEARGFVYLVSVSGVTGQRGALSSSISTLIQRVQGISPIPVALGFGISTAEDAHAAAQAGAKGVVVGTRLVRDAAEAGGDPGRAVRDRVSSFATALRS